MKYLKQRICIQRLMAGDEGFEPPILGPEPSALPLGQSPLQGRIIPNVRILIHSSANYYYYIMYNKLSNKKRGLNDRNYQYSRYTSIR